MSGEAMAVAMGVPLDDIAHIVQVALTPVFLLSGIASLLNVINARLARLADQVEALRERFTEVEGIEAVLLARRMRRLGRRLGALDMARAAGALGGMCICAATFLLFLGALQNAAIATLLFLCFGASVLLTFAALAGMFGEAMLSSRRVRRP